MSSLQLSGLLISDIWIGRAFATRVLLHIANVDFDDKLVKTVEEWKELKGERGYNEKLPLGQIPTFDAGNGVIRTQGEAIARYVDAKYKIGFYPEDIEERFTVDEIIGVSLYLFHSVL